MLSDLLIRLRALFRRKAVESELDDELRFHFDQQVEKLVRAGLPVQEARRRARLLFGGADQIKEECREARGVHFVETLTQDILRGLRVLRKSPGFTAVALLTLALGIGANSAIFSVVEGVVLAPLPYAEPERLVMVLESNARAPQLYTSYPDFQDWQRNARSFQQMVAVVERSFDLTNPGTPERLDGKEVSAGLFTILGERLALGRDFSPQEDQRGGAPVAIISDRLWRNHFAGRPAALGETVTMDGLDYTIVGVLAPGFRILGQADVYTPLGQGDPLIVDDRTVHAIACIARLKPGATTTQAQAEMSAVQNSLDQLYASADRGLGAVVLPLKQEIVGNVDRTLLMLLGAAGLVLLIACANVASLLLARAAARTREFAIRAALGASRARVIRQLLTESVLLSVAGGAVGALIAIVGIRPLLAAMPESLPRSENIGVNASVLLFTFGVSVAVGILFGLAPALKSSKADLQAALKEGGRGATHGHRAQSSLVIIQMALTLVLLLGAGLLFRTIRHLWDINPGFDTQHIITFKVGLSRSATEKPSNIGIAYQQMLERIRRIPGVQSADFTNIVPLTGADNGTPFWFGQQKPASMAEAPRLLMFWTGPDYLKAMGIPLLQGRFLGPQDTNKSEPVIVIDSVMAHAYFPDKDAVGQTISIAHWGTIRIIGVVGHVTHWGLDRPNFYTQNQAYGAFYQLPEPFMKVFEDQTVIVHTPLDAGVVMPAIKEAVYGADRDQPIYNVQTVQEIVSRSMSSQRFPMILLGAFAGLALLLASVGIYGAISYSVTLRIHEIGIRMALGAEKSDVLRMVVAQGVRLALTGIAMGAVSALILTRLLSSFSHLIYGIGTSDPVTFIGVSAGLTGVAILACYLPARRAARVDPMVALRYE